MGSGLDHPIDLAPKPIFFLRCLTFFSYFLNFIQIAWAVLDIEKRQKERKKERFAN